MHPARILVLAIGLVVLAAFGQSASAADPLPGAALELSAVLQASPTPTASPDTRDPVKRDCIANWTAGYVPDPSLDPPTNFQVVVDAEEKELRLSWVDNAVGETCYGVISNVKIPDTIPVILATAANKTQATLPLQIPDITGLKPHPLITTLGTVCLKAFAANASGLSAYSNEPCFELTPELQRQVGIQPLVGLPSTGGSPGTGQAAWPWSVLAVATGGALSLVALAGLAFHFRRTRL